MFVSLYYARFLISLSPFLVVFVEGRTLEGHSNIGVEEKRAERQENCSRKPEGSDPGEKGRRLLLQRLKGPPGVHAWAHSPSESIARL